MYKNKNQDGSLNISGKRISFLRKKLYPKTSQKALADQLQLVGLDIDKNAVQRMESGQRFVTDIELCALTKALNTSADYLLGLTEKPSNKERTPQTP